MKTRCAEQSTVMSVNGLTCILNMPGALRQQFWPDGQERSQPLPPYREQPAFPVDEYPACPENWMHGSGMASSYFVPVEAERGMWLDFNRNAGHSRHVAVVISVQGLNPVTGQPTKGALRLEQYRHVCPVHEQPFKQERFCELCGYKWPAQNYLATTGTSHGFFWIDGFRGADGIVRQYVFTEAEVRGIAAQVIGHERVFAVGIAFYFSKAPKPQPALPRVRVRGMTTGTQGAPAAIHHVEVTPEVAAQQEKQFLDPAGLQVPLSLIQLVPESVARECLILPLSQEGEALNIVSGDPDDTEMVERLSFILNRPVRVTALAPRTALQEAIWRHYGDGSCESVDSMVQEFTDTAINFSVAVDDVVASLESVDGEAPSQSAERLEKPRLRRASATETTVKRLEVAAGARIDQEVYPDPESLDFWQDTPAGLIYVNYVDVEAAERIIAAGRRDLTARGEGFMQGLKVGHPVA